MHDKAASGRSSLTWHVARAATLFAISQLAAASALAQLDPRAPDVIAAIRAQLGADGFAPGASYAIAFSDLNDNHQPEAIVHLNDRNFCGSAVCQSTAFRNTIMAGSTSASMSAVAASSRASGPFGSSAVAISRTRRLRRGSASYPRKLRCCSVRRANF